MMIRMIHWNDIIIKANNAAAMYLKIYYQKHQTLEEKRERKSFRKKNVAINFFSMWLI